MRTSLVALLAASTLALAACSGSSDAARSTSTTSGQTTTTAVKVPSDAEDTDQVVIAAMAFDPKVIHVQAGTTVTWSNQDSRPHTATSDDGRFDTGTIAPGDRLTVTFDDPGTFRYHCSIHQGMTGTVVVTP